MSTRAQSTPRRRGERVQELELRGAGRGDHARLPGPRDRLADRRRGPLRRRAPELLLGVEDPDVHSAASRRARPRARPTRNSATASPSAGGRARSCGCRRGTGSARGPGRRPAAGSTSITVMPRLARDRELPVPQRRWPCPWGRARRRRSGPSPPPRARPRPRRAEVLEVLVGPVDHHQQHLLRLPGQDVGVEAVHGPRRGEPAPLELPELHLRVLAGEDRRHHRHEGARASTSAAAS